MAETRIPVKVRRVVLHPERPPSTFNRVLWTRVGSEAVIEFGYYDLNDVRAVVERAKEEPQVENELTVYITERYSITPLAFLELIRQGCGLARELAKEGVIKAEEFQKALEGKE